MKIFILTVCFFVNLYSHPHFFVDVNIDIQENKIMNKWLFDRVNSRLLIFDFDKNRNKIFEKDEQDAFIKAHFEKLKADNYNIFMELDNKELIINPSNIELRLLKKRVELSFEFLAKVNEGGIVCTIDPTLYFAYKLIDTKSIYESEIEKSEHDFCIGISK